MKRASNELFLYHTPETASFKKLLAYAKSIADFIHEIDIIQMPLTELQLEELLIKAHTSVEEIINQEHPIYQEKYANAVFDEQDWLKILIHTPELLKYTIAVLGDKTMVVKEPNEILGLKN